MNIFKSRKGSFSITDKEVRHRVRYLGNIQTSIMKGDGCVDKPVEVLWRNFIRSPSAGLDMKLTVGASGLKAQTKEQGLTEYRAHRISYYIAHPDHPRIFAWVYRHEGRKMKIELRCHAVLCKSDVTAKVFAVTLHEKLSFALKEFLREKTRNQNSRLVLQRSNSSNKGGSAVPLRKQLLSTGQQYKPPVSSSNKAPKLGAISEEDIAEEIEENDDTISMAHSDGSDTTQSAMELLVTMAQDNVNLDGDIDVLSERILDCQIEMGNNLEQLKLDEKVKLRLQSSQSSESDDENPSRDQKRNSASSEDSDVWGQSDNSYDEITAGSDVINVNGIEVMITAF